MPIPVRAALGASALLRTSPAHLHQSLTLRLLSSSTASASSSSSSNTALAISTTLNPPSSTLPPPLVVPARGADQSAPSYLFSTGKAYLGFYKTGLRAVWNNHKAAAAQFQSKVRSAGYNHVDAAAAGGALTRSQWQLSRRASADTRRIPMFALLFAVCGEFTPLVVVFAGALVPNTCRIPKQIEVERRGRKERRRISREERAQEPRAEKATSTVADLRHIGRRLDLYARMWDRALGGLPSALLRGRVQRRLEYLRLDDELLGVDGPQGLADEEIRVACEERGIDVLDGKNHELPVELLRERLTGWLQAAKQRPLEELVLDDGHVAR